MGEKQERENPAPLQTLSRDSVRNQNIEYFLDKLDLAELNPQGGIFKQSKKNAVTEILNSHLLSKSDCLHLSGSTRERCHNYKKKKKKDLCTWQFPMQKTSKTGQGRLPQV